MAGHGRNERGLAQIYLEIPVITRTFTTAAVLLTVAVNIELISIFKLYLNPALILNRHQYWRILTPFLYAGPASFGTLFHLLFGYRYSRIMEEGFFYRRSSDFLFLYLFLATVIFTLSLLFTELVFLGPSFTHAILYLWCRRNPHAIVLIFGLLTIRADYIPYVLILLNLLTGSPMSADILAIVAGHLYFFLEDVFPKQRYGFRILRTPRILKLLFDDELPEREVSPDQERVDVIEDNNNNNDLINNVPVGPGVM